MKIFNIIPLLFLMCSCTQIITERNKSQILGEWYPLDGENLKGYHFMENNLCENHLGYYDRYFIPENRRPEESAYICEENNSLQIYFNEQNIINYQGNTTSYEVNKDSLKIYDLSKKTFAGHKIKFLSRNIMLLSSNNDSFLNKYERRVYQIDTMPLFDEIIFFVKGDLGPRVSIHLEDKYISIKNTGEVVTLSDLKFKRFKMNPNEFEHIEGLFKKADIKTIIENYKRQDKRDSEFVTSSITFVKGDKIVLSIENPIGTINTKEFLWAYLSALFCPDYNQLETCNNYGLDSSEYVSELFLWSTRFSTKDSVLKLYDSECFYLRDLLIKATKTDHDFSPIYILRYSPILAITPIFKTDGRFYWYQGKEGDKKTVTLDLGFNFIEENNLANQFKKR